MKKIKGGVTAAKGFAAAYTAAGIKYQDRDDMALIMSEEPCRVAGTFTSNVVKAAPVVWDRQLVTSGETVRAIVVNAGIANACTGAEGMGYCRDTAEALADLAAIKPEEVLVASTGVIGMQIPMDRIRAGVAAMYPLLSEELEAGNGAAKAIMTTDTREKEAAVTLELDGATVTIGGMCKGSGMIHPNMCTMLSFVTTDVDMDAGLLQEALSAVVTDTYNMVSVDGDTSTNDTCLLLANGRAGNAPIVEKDGRYDAFVEALTEVSRTLAKMMAADGEGATALLEVKVVGAASKADAVALSKSVITSSLTKAAVYGHDANWGRILCALGYAGVTFDPDRVELDFESARGKCRIFSQGVATDYSEELASKILSADAVTVVCDMHMGCAEATAWGCDLTYDYVKINADYRS